MTSAFTQKLARGIGLSAPDCAVLEEIIPAAFTTERGDHLIREGDIPKAIFLLREGWAARYKMLPDGRRQILAFLIPGDICDLHVFLRKKMDHGVVVLSPGSAVAIAPETMKRVIDAYPTIARALSWTTLVDQAVLREWLTSVAQRDALAKTAHLFCEIWLRLRAVGLVEERRFALPMTQVDLGDALGLTSVHVNRQLQRMRTEGLIKLERQELTISDPTQLAALCGFDPNYLHMSRDDSDLPW
jgi:CRP-like cAMP-binding protein